MFSYFHILFTCLEFYICHMPSYCWWLSNEQHNTEIFGGDFPWILVMANSQTLHSSSLSHFYQAGKLNAITCSCSIRGSVTNSKESTVHPPHIEAHSHPWLASIAVIDRGRGMPPDSSLIWPWMAVASLGFELVIPRLKGDHFSVVPPESPTVRF